jgi:hypothetical protein
MPDPITERRTKLRLGFALCCATLALAAVALLGSLSARLLAGSTETDAFDARVRQIACVLEIVFEAVFISGLVCLHLASNGVRWRRTVPARGGGRSGVRGGGLLGADERERRVP